MRIKCEECGQKYEVSKPVKDDEALKCLECGSMMSFPQTSADSSLAGPSEPRLSLTGEPLEGVGRIPPAPKIRLKADGTPLVETDLQPPVAITKDQSSYVSAFVFLAVGGLMILFQYFAPHLQVYAEMYIMVRNISIVVAWLMIVTIAFQDEIGRGLLSVVFPPYLMLYVTGQVESGWVRGFFFGVLLGVCAEAYLLPNTSLILGLGPSANDFIERVTHWINAISRRSV